MIKLCLWIRNYAYLRKFKENRPSLKSKKKSNNHYYHKLFIYNLNKNCFQSFVEFICFEYK